MSTEPQLQPRPKPLPPKKRYSVLLPQELAERFERVAGLRHGSKSAIVEEALDRRLNPEKYPLIGDALLRRLDEQSRSIATLKRDTVIVAEMLSLFVRYFLTITPPLGEREQQPARALGKERFQVFVAQIGRRLASDRRLVSEILESIAAHSPDLLTTIGDDVPLRAPPAHAGNTGPVNPRSNGHSASHPPMEKPDA
jgi:predicted DNA-binding protein